jgi:hypothetical protein
MTDRVDAREAISAALKDFTVYPLPEAASRLFATMGYTSERRVPIASTKDFCERFDPQCKLTDRERKSLDCLDSLHLLFQLTDAELTAQRGLFDDPAAVETTKINSYLFFAAELPSATYTRTALSSIARAINKPLPMPALVLLRHGDCLSLAIIHRRLNKRDSDRDVLEKATLIKDIRFADPIRAHLEILNDFVSRNLDADFGIHNFVSLHNAWQKRLGSYSLNERFYREIATWYFSAITHKSVKLPRTIANEKSQDEHDRNGSFLATYSALTLSGNCSRTSRPWRARSIRRFCRICSSQH